ncbi:hypothetical protein V6Z11_A06G074900 [Gossypium hirsutum]
MMGIAEIVDFCDFLSPTPEEQAAPMQLCILFLMLSSTYGLPAGQKFLGRSGQGFIHQQVILISRIKEIGSGLGKNESCRLVAPSRFTTSEVYPLVRVGRAGDIITLSSHYL